MSSDVLSEEAERLRAWIADLRVGTLAVQSASVHAGDDASGDTAIFVDLVLPSPSLEAGTWPIDDVLSLHDLIDREAKALGLQHPWHVRLYPDQDLEPDPDE